jgi:DNA-directed RNA polymerase subunit RPC12/RpoP
MKNEPIHRIPKKVELYEVACWRCSRIVELATSWRPYRYPHCGALLLIKWRSVRKPTTTAL